MVTLIIGESSLCMFLFMLILKGGIELFTREGITLTNYNFNVDRSMVYSHMTINQLSAEYFEDHIISLQNEVTWFMDFIEKAIAKIDCFFENLTRNEAEEKYVNGLEEVFNLAKRKFEEKGLALKEDIIHTVAKKKINAVSYKKLKQIINTHQQISEELIEKELNFKRIEIVSNYLREVIGYLKRDFNVWDLPNAQVLLSKTGFVSQNYEVSSYQFPDKLYDHVSA